jgi:hypothetical protein
MMTDASTIIIYHLCQIIIIKSNESALGAAIHEQCPIVHSRRVDGDVSLRAVRPS